MRPSPLTRRVPTRHAPSPMLLLLPFVLLLSTGCSDIFDTPPLYEGMPEHVRTRHVVLEGAHNFRDLGGYETTDGRRVKSQTFYRSDNLSGLTDADLEKLSDLGIALVCDFRGPSEWQEEPDRLPEANPPKVAHLEIWDPSFTAEGFKEALSSGTANAELGSLLVEGNRLFAWKFSDRYHALFERITRPENLPALVHCTAGKDRAGFASALILRVLGVPMETIYDDYLLTNHYTAKQIEKRIFMIRLMSLFRADADGLRSVLGVERRFLEAAFDEIDARYGSFDAYRREALGLSDAQLEQFRNASLE